MREVQGIVVATLNFEGFLWFLKPFLPSKVTLQCTIEEDPSCPGRYDWSQQTLGADGKPDGRNKKAGSIQLHPSGDAGRCMISSLSEVACQSRCYSATRTSVWTTLLNDS